MKKLLAIPILVILIVLTLPGCDSTDEPIIDTDLERMLGFVPDSVLEVYDIWFDNWARAKEIHGFEDITSVERFLALPVEQRNALARAFRELSVMMGLKIWLVEMDTGFDVMMLESTVYTNIPPHSFYVAEGNFDENLIAGRLTDLGYTLTNYDDYSYYGISGDYEIDPNNPLSREVLAAMNRVAILDNTLVIAPSTGHVTGVFDAMSGNAASAIDNAGVRALADTLGDVLTAIITLPERVLSSYPASDDPVFFFEIPQDWDTLHQYEMVGLGLRAEGEEHYVNIALYYADKADAEADVEELVKRMESYRLGSDIPNFNAGLMTDCFDIGPPSVKEYGDGAVLSINCRHIPDSRWGPVIFIQGLIQRDLLFLVPDPSRYIAK